jgi:23S rRNA pseudouridine1911/1915/1917 synthase
MSLNNLEILLADEGIVVCIKPVGMDSEHQLPEALKETLGGEIFPLHRLDQNVGGVMVYARTKSSAAALSRAIQDGSMVKEYVAMVHGTPPESGDWTDLLFKDSRKNKVFVVKKQRAGVKSARLEYSLLYGGETSLVAIRLYTGRSHQIRVQFSSRGFPLVGDHKYGSRAVQTAPMLYSCRLTFPYHGKTIQFESYPEWAEH